MNTMDDLLAKYMLGEATRDEQATITQWMEESEDNRKYFDHFKLIWDTSGTLKTESRLDPDASWIAFKQLVDKKPEAIVKPINSFNKWVKIAAVWLFICGSAVLLYNLLWPGKVNQLTLQTTAIVKTCVLPDGSTVTLNKNSVVTYPDKFTGNTREIKLNKGEAFFNIAPNKSKPFIISVNDVKVQVVGTSFNIKSEPLTTEVIVETGIVQVIRKNVVIRLKPQEKVKVTNGKFKKTQSGDELYNYYRTGTFVANKTPLWRLVEVLNEAYHAKIVITDRKTANQQITTVIKTTEPLDTVLKLIGNTLNVRINKQAQNNYSISKY